MKSKFPIHPDTARLDKLQRSENQMGKKGRFYWISTGYIAATSDERQVPEGKPIFRTVREAIDALPEHRSK